MSCHCRPKLLVRRFLLGYLWLSHDAISSNVKRYKSRPKPLGITMVHVRWFSFSFVSNPGFTPGGTCSPI